jgi:citrate lyase subunit beta/citryl-CoA lyase
MERSFLFVPGDRPERFDKAVATGADMVVLDLEDAVAPAAKQAARLAVAAWLPGRRQVAVRINAADTPWYEDDLAMLRAAVQATPMLPKADAASLARTVDAVPGRPVIALLETVSGYLGLRMLAATPGLQRIAFGSIDFGAESGIADEGGAMTAVRTQIVLESCHAGLQAPVDGVSVEFNDAARMREDVEQSRRLGFGGKLCIHPRQVGVVTQAFQPTRAERDWARRVLDAFTQSGGAATAVDGRMVDKPVVERARRILETSAPGPAA